MQAAVFKELMLHSLMINGDQTLEYSPSDVFNNPKVH